MKLMKICQTYLKVTACVLFLGLSAQAQDVGVVLGFRSDNADSDSIGGSVGGKSNIQGGMIAKFELSGPLQVRTGAVYVQRAYEVSGSTETKASYLEIPAGLLYKFSDYGGVFAGGAISMNIAKDCPGSCSGAEVATSPVALQFGGSFKIAPQFGFEFYYETMTAKFAKGITNPRAIAANLMITFD